MPGYVKGSVPAFLEREFKANTGTAFNDHVYSVAVQSDGKILIGGTFTIYNGVTVNRIVRLNADGAIDTTFTTNTGTGFNASPRAIAIQSDGKIVAGGVFTTFNGVTVNRIVRLNSDGTRDTTFTTNTGTAFDSTVNSIAIQSDGKIVIGGNFTTFNGTTVNRIVRLNTDGTRDTTFTTNTGTAFDSEVRSIATQSDGKIVCGGEFFSFNGVTVNGIVRLNSNGTRDTTFTLNTDILENSIFAIAIQSDGKIICGGDFFTYSGATVRYIVRLNTDGTMDTTFTTNNGTGLNFSVRSIAIQSDGGIVIGGEFATFNGVTANRIVRLNSDGTRDTTFTTGTGFNFQINSIAIQSDGKIIVGGFFTTFNGARVNRIVRLTNWRTVAPWGKVSGTWAKAKEAYANVSGTWKQWWLDGGVNDRTFTEFDVYSGSSSTVDSVAVQSDGKLVIGGAFLSFNRVTVNRIVRLNSDGTRDASFTTNTGTGFNNPVYSIAIQSDGKIVIGGFFTTFNGVTVNRIVRLNSDGTLDTTFTTNTGTAFNNTVDSIAIQSDGKLIIGGQFSTFNGVTANYIVRLNSDGTIDTAFTANTDTALNSSIYSIAIQSDGKIVIGGFFTTFNGLTINRIARLNSDGTRDATFTTNTGTAFSDAVRSVAIQSDGKLVIGGNFITFNGVTVNRIVRLNSDGTRDTAFTTNNGTGLNAGVESIAIQSDGKIVIGGSFTSFNVITVNRIARLNADGTRDTTFTTNTGTGFNGIPSAIVIQSDGKIVVGGDFTIFNGVTVNFIVRLNSDGTRDTGVAIGTAFNSSVYSTVIQSDGKIIVGGNFATFNGATVNRIVRLNSDGTIDTAFTTNTGTGFVSVVFSIAIQADNKIIIGGDFATFNGTTVNRIVRLNADGTRDTTFTTNTGTAFNSFVRSIAIQSDGKIICGGLFTTFNGATVNRIVRLNTDGTIDTTFTTNTGTAFNDEVVAIAIQSDGNIVVGGLFTDFNGTTVNRIVRLVSDGTRETALTTNAGTAFNGSVNSIAIQEDGQIVVGGSFSTFNGVTVNRIVRLNSVGTRNTTFTTGAGFNSVVNSIVIQTDGKIVIGGGFTTFNGATVNRIVRRNSDGTIDTAFTTNTGTGFDGTIRSAVIQSDGKLVISGDFTIFNSIFRTRLARIGGE
jgi:uncharacterized delta-60 repeat protein